VQEFIAFLKAHHTVLDPTMGIFQALFCGDPAAVTPGLESDRPAFSSAGATQHAIWRTGAPKGQETAYREAFPALLRLLKALNDAGVTIIPGTDSLSGIPCCMSWSCMYTRGSPRRRYYAWRL